MSHCPSCFALGPVVRQRGTLTLYLLKQQASSVLTSADIQKYWV